MCVVSRRRFIYIISGSLAAFLGGLPMIKLSHGQCDGREIDISRAGVEKIIKDEIERFAKSTKSFRIEFTTSDKEQLARELLLRIEETGCYNFGGAAWPNGGKK